MPLNSSWGKSQYLEALKQKYPTFEVFIPKLTGREQVVIRSRLKGQYLREVAAQLRVTTERIRQMEAKAVRKLRWLCSMPPS